MPKARGAVWLMGAVMPASRHIIIGFSLASLLGAAALAWRAGPGDSGFRVTFLRASDYGPHRRIVVLQVTNSGYGRIEFRSGHQYVQAKVGEMWREPTELHGLGDSREAAFIGPAEAGACRLLLEFRREPLSQRVLLFL